MDASGGLYTIGPQGKTMSAQTDPGRGPGPGVLSRK